MESSSDGYVEPHTGKMEQKFHDKVRQVFQ